MTTIEKTDLKERILSFAETATLPGHAYDSIRAMRSDALSRFAEKGFPGKKDEEYKYANIRPLVKDITISEQKATIDGKQVADVSITLEDCIKLVFVNGTFIPGLSVVSEHKGLSIERLADAISSEDVRKALGSFSDPDDPFVALNTVLWYDGTLLRFSRNCIIEKPIYCLHIATSDSARMNQQRLLVMMDEGASATIIEHYETVDLSAISFTNTVSEIVMKSDAILHHYILENECENGVMVNSTNTCIDGKANYHINTVSLNGAFVRNNLTIALNSSHSEANLFGLYIADDSSLIDNHTLVDHRMPDCQSNELYKGIIDGKATGVFNGKIFVRQDAQKTNAFQSNKNILLSDDASMNTKPQLEIYADDVKCSHGSSTGEINQEALFYLRSRGISPDSAKRLMIQAFADDVINNIKQEDVRNFVTKLVNKKLG